MRFDNMQNGIMAIKNYKLNKEVHLVIVEVSLTLLN
jgi:hypothetical protein